ncbi:thermitase [Desulfofundulus luciae]|uniref:Thermitase n=1 Tax=Desulfofundulus luciae TaxID=74702 RepID=A0ABU0B6D0_9FIRM|nr:S8 family peptidase [Desulfofundulus luciae]MDQ0287815.1 thermitase [Desulfofundulus luciae]
MMCRKIFSVIVSLVFGLTVLGTPLFAAVVPLRNFGGGTAPSRVVVKFKAGTDDAVKRKVHAMHGGRVVREIPALGVQVVEVPAEKAKEKADAYQREGSVEFAEPDCVAKALEIPNDSYFSKQWDMNNTGQTGGKPDADIDAPEAWDVTASSPSVKIAILDTGIDQDHEDMAGKIVGNVNFTISPTVDDFFGHGTHVAGIAAAVGNNEKGIAGTAYNASLMNVKVLDDTGSGYYSWIAEGIVWAVDNGARVINMSLGGTQPSRLLEQAVNYAWSKGAVLVAAAGNEGSKQPLYPAAYKNCIAVAATDANDQKAAFSSYGKWVTVAAPGVNIFSTLPNHPSVVGSYLGVTGYGALDGTSMATPHVSGVAALVWASKYGTGNQAVRKRIESTADRIAGTGTYWAYGRVNAYNAVH